MSATQEQKAELKVLNHLRRGWKAVINKRTFYAVFVRRWDEMWVPPGPTGATIARMMGKGLLDFEPEGRTICGLEIIKSKKRRRP